jgi:UDP-N-acetylglucosamine:LPS N-acetylglucosamine transferase
MDYAIPITAYEQFEILILLSGPEPQRSIFEKIVTSQLVKQNRRSVIIGGQVEENQENKMPISEYLGRIPFSSGDELYSMLVSAKYIICRSGYSTIMDLTAIRKTAFLVPTPGQTEQEYLASYLQEMGLFRFSNQKDFDLDYAIKKLDEIGLPDFSFVQTNLLDNALDDLISIMKSN